MMYSIKLAAFQTSASARMKLHMAGTANRRISNVEDLSTKGHTGNEVPLWVVGPMAEQLKAVKSITEILDKILPQNAALFESASQAD